MALPDPRTLPDMALVACTFSLDDNTAASASGRGALINVTRTFDPMWRVRVETRPLYADEWPIWQAWKASLRGGVKTFIAHDHARPTPLAYRSAQAPADISAGWDGTAGVISVGLSGALSLSSLPSAYQFKVGDLIGLEQNGRYGLYLVQEDVTAAAGIASVTVAPFLHSVFTNAAVARIWRPVAQFVIDWRSWSGEPAGNPTPISFEAFQRL